MDSVKIRRADVGLVLVNGAFCLSIIFIVIFGLGNLYNWLRITLIAIFVLFQALLVLFYFWRQTTLFRITCILMLTAVTMFMLYAVARLTGLTDRFENVNSVREFIKSTGMWGNVVYIALQILQVVLLPIPSIILDIAGLAAFGSLRAFILILIGVLSGSMIAFTLGKVFGKKLAAWAVGADNAEKYRRAISKKGYFFLAVMFIFPFFPDDLLCIVAGLSAISYGEFFLLIVFTRPLSIAFLCFFGTGAIIPFHGWGLVVWIAFFVLLVAAFIIFNRFKARIFNRNNSRPKLTSATPVPPCLSTSQTVPKKNTEK